MSFSVVNRTSCDVTDSLTILVGESQIVFMHDPAADIVLLVDESGSMYSEHQWLRQMVKLLDDMLKKHGVGVMQENLFAIIGYGSQYQNYEFGRVLSPGGQHFVTADDIDLLVDELWVDGRREDGYVAIQFAFDNLQFRNGTAKQYILITDENRHILVPSLTYSFIRNLLIATETRLNVIVGENFEGDDNVIALGMDGSMNAYVYYPPAAYVSEFPANLSVRVVSGGQSVPYSAHKSTHEDYTNLALETGGAAWDLSSLSAGPPLSDAFTSAFVNVKVQEILDQLSSCRNCSCELDGLQCTELKPFNGVYPECSKLLPTCTCIACALISSVHNTLPFFLGIPEFEGAILSLDDYLNVSINPSFVSIPIRDDQNISLECKVDGFDASHRWTFKGRELESNSVISSSGDSSSFLTLIDPQMTNTGWYTCFAVRADNSQGTPQLFPMDTGLATAYVEVYRESLLAQTWDVHTQYLILFFKKNFTSVYN